jgi:hypothetical protein
MEKIHGGQTLSPEAIANAEGQIRDLIQQVAMGPSTEERRELESMVEAIRKVRTQEKLEEVLAKARRIEYERSSLYR